MCFDNELKIGPIEISSLALYIVDGTKWSLLARPMPYIPLYMSLSLFNQLTPRTACSDSKMSEKKVAWDVGIRIVYVLVVCRVGLHPV